VISPLALSAANVAAGAGNSPAPAASAGPAPLDVTADPVPDTAATLADELARRTALMLVETNGQQEEAQARLDRMRSAFDGAQQERAELLREMDVLRDMALEQQKRDDETLKKWIALI
jgi:hypothetical protein